MTVRFMSFNTFLLPMLLLTLLTACGGGGGGNSAPASAAQPSLTPTQTKLLRFTWNDVSGATTYKLLEDPDGVSGFTQVGNDIAAGTQQYDHRVPLYARINARYILQSCNASGCTDSSTVNVSDTLASAIGYFKASNTGAGDYFGNSVALSADGSTLAVGARRENSPSTGVNGAQNNDDGTADVSGAVYVFTFDGTNWNQQAYIKASNTGAGDTFGHAIALSDDGNTLAVGAFNEDSNTTGINSIPNDDGNADNSGAVYVFTRSGNTWTEQAYLKAGNTGAGDTFGIAVALAGDGNTLAVGAYTEDSNTTGINSTPNDDGNADNSGAVYLFTRSGSIWGQTAYIKASNAQAGDQFGNAVALAGDGNTLAVGAFKEDSKTTGINTTPNDDGSADNSGAVYVFSRNGTSWSQQAYVKPFNTGAGDQFGRSVALADDGNTLVVGTSQEDSNTSGINTTPNDDGNATSSGAAYVFIRSGGLWGQQAYLKSGNTGAYDSFGNSVDIAGDGNTLVVGSPFEDSNTAGINTTPTDDSFADNSGAAYVFTRSGSTWVQQAYLKPGNPGFYDNVGISVAVSGDGNTLAAGAYFEDSNSTGINSTPSDDGMADDSGAVYLY